MFDLTGRVAVVTGGGGVLCSGFAKTIAACGAKVAVLDLNPAAAQKVVDEIIADISHIFRGNRQFFQQIAKDDQFV